MSIFCYKKMDAAVRLGEQLKLKREELGLSVDDLAEKTHIPRKYVEALERNGYHDLPKAKAYRLAYIKEYATTVGLSPTVCVSQLECEDGIDTDVKTHPYQGIKWFPFASISIFLRNVVLIGAAALFATYLIWQVKGVLEPPELSVFTPQEGLVYNKPQVDLVGQTERETELSVNGQKIMVDEQGHFNTPVDLKSGLNTITVEATKKHGKTTVIVRHIVVKESINQPQISLR